MVAGNNSIDSTRWVALFQIFGAKLVLEVFGGAGAIWGFSEAIGLRNSTNVWFWRPCALAFGAIFFGRWLSQLLEFTGEERYKLQKEVPGKRSSGIDSDEENISMTETSSLVSRESDQLCSQEPRVYS